MGAAVAGAVCAGAGRCLLAGGPRRFNTETRKHGESTEKRSEEKGFRFSVFGEEPRRTEKSAQYSGKKTENRKGLKRGGGAQGSGFRVQGKNAIQRSVFASVSENSLAVARNKIAGEREP